MECEYIEVTTASATHVRMTATAIKSASCTAWLARNIN